MKVTAFEASAATGLLVAGATWLGARMNSGTQAQRERKARADERRQVFQQETLIGLQDALQDLYRILEEHIKQRFPPEIDDEQVVDLPAAYPRNPLTYRTAEAAVDKLRARVLDDDLRALIDHLLDAADEVMGADTRRAAENGQDKLWGLESVWASSSATAYGTCFSLTGRSGREQDLLALQRVVAAGAEV